MHSKKSPRSPLFILIKESSFFTLFPKSLVILKSLIANRYISYISQKPLSIMNQWWYLIHSFLGLVHCPLSLLLPVCRSFWKCSLLWKLQGLYVQVSKKYNYLDNDGEKKRTGFLSNMGHFTFTSGMQCMCNTIFHWLQQPNTYILCLTVFL